MKFFFSLLFSLPALILSAQEIIMEQPFNQQDALKGWYKPIDAAITAEGLRIQVEKIDPKKQTQCIYFHPNAATIAGKKIRVEVEAKGINLTGRAQVGKFMLNYKSGGKDWWPQTNPPAGTYDWTKFSFEQQLPADTSKPVLCLGIDGGSGTILFRNLKITLTDTFIDLSRQMNMGYSDKTANDGQGGWSDQGSDNDASKFDFTKTTYANVPFQVIDPKKNNGKSVLVFQSSRFKNGLTEAVFELPGAGIEGKWLYLLHTMTYGSKECVGRIELTGTTGKTQRIEIVGDRDLNDWWMVKPAVNAHPAAIWTNSGGGIVGIFASAFRLQPDLGAIRSIKFIAAPTNSVWLVLAATISFRQYEFPKAQLMTTKENDVWKKFTMPEKYGTIPGSALDRTQDNARQPVGSFGKVIINRDGHFAFEQKPEEQIRFFAALFNNPLIQSPTPGKPKVLPQYLFPNSNQDQKSAIRDFAKSLRLKGYNMTRMHGIEGELAQKKGLDIPPEVFDNFFWAIKCLKDNGIYLNLDVAATSLAYNPGITWAPWTWPKNHKDSKTSIYFDPASRANWTAGAKKMLTTVNPYTGLRLIDDPILVMLIGYNEQEFSLSTSRELPDAMPTYRKFMEEKYGDIEKLKAAWGVKNNWKSFNDLPIVHGTDALEPTTRGRDMYEYVRKIETEIYNFYVTTLRELGWKGPVTNFNMGKSIQYALARDPMPCVAMNSYHAHPSNYIQPGSSIDQSSSIATAANVARGFYSLQMPGKPYIITEHGHVFWNRYRYEQAFVTNGYGALQGIDGITAFIGQDGSPHGKMHPFCGAPDPIMHAEEFLAYYIYRRGDVKTATTGTRVLLDEKDVLDNYAYRWGLSSDQTNLVLLGQFCVEKSNNNQPVRPLRQSEIAIKRTGGSAVIVDTAGFSKIVDDRKNTFDLAAMVRNIKQQKLLPASNRTDVDRDIYESSTGELYLDARKSFMSINTPRLQGICGLAGTEIKLPAFEVRQMTVNGNLAVVAVDDSQTLTEAHRLVVVYATDALNTGMVFNDDSRRTMQKLGDLPVLYECGKFTVAITNRNATKLKAFALGLEGQRRGEIPVKADGDRLILSVDTGKLPGGPTVFFELAEK